MTTLNDAREGLLEALCVMQEATAAPAVVSDARVAAAQDAYDAIVVPVGLPHSDTPAMLAALEAAFKEKP